MLQGDQCSCHQQQAGPVIRMAGGVQARRVAAACWAVGTQLPRAVHVGQYQCGSDGGPGIGGSRHRQCQPRPHESQVWSGGVGTILIRVTAAVAGTLLTNVTATPCSGWQVHSEVTNGRRRAAKQARRCAAQLALGPGRQGGRTAAAAPPPKGGSGSLISVRPPGTARRIFASRCLR